MLAFKVKGFGGPILQTGVLKVGAPDVRSKLFIPQGNTGSWAFPPNCTALHQAGFSGKSASQPFLPVSLWIFSHSPDVRELLSWCPGFLLRELLHIQLHNPGYLWEQRFRRLVYNHLDQLQSKAGFIGSLGKS